MSELKQAIIGTAIGLTVVFICLIGYRWLSSATTQVVIKTPKPGIECATIITRDGAAIDCWHTGIAVYGKDAVEAVRDNMIDGEE